MQFEEQLETTDPGVLAEVESLEDAAAQLDEEESREEEESEEEIEEQETEEAEEEAEENEG